MTQEDKQLLIKDLCARLPYMGFMVQWRGEDYNIINIGYGRVTVLKPFMSMTSDSPLIEEVKPYLRPMLSMTYDEECEWKEERHYDIAEQLDWLNSHHFDYRNLIENGLALEAPEGMYKTE